MNRSRSFLPVIILLLFSCNLALAQAYDSLGLRHVNLDSVVVRSGFDMKAFIRRVQNDTTFYKAFRSMRLIPYRSVVDFTAYDRRNNIEASFHANASQVVNAKRCRQTLFDHKTVAGDFYDRHNELNYYTAGLFFSLFFAEKPVCNEDDIVARGFDLKDKSRIEKSKYELKQLMFNPGAKVSGVPFIGDKASVFDADEVEKYNFRVSMDTYEGEDVFVFDITPRPEYMNKVVFSELKTWFRRSDYSIVARDYSLAYNTLFYDFDVHMKVRMKQMNSKLYPVYIYYDGNWKVATKSRERMKVVMDVVY